jgi:hypothetical protein
MADDSNGRGRRQVSECVCGPYYVSWCPSQEHRRRAALQSEQLAWEALPQWLQYRFMIDTRRRCFTQKIA